MYTKLEHQNPPEQGGNPSIVAATESVTFKSFFSEDESLFIFRKFKNIEILNTNTLSSRSMWSEDKAFPALDHIGLLPGNRVLVALNSESSIIHLYDIETGQEMNSIEVRIKDAIAKVKQFCVSPTKNEVLLCCLNAHGYYLKLMMLEEKKLVSCWETSISHCQWQKIQFHPTKDIVSYATNTAIFSYSSTDGSSLSSVDTGYCFYPKQIRYSSDGSKVGIIGSEKGLLDSTNIPTKVKIFDCLTDELLQSIEIKSEIYPPDFQFSEDSTGIFFLTKTEPREQPAVSLIIAVAAPKKDLIYGNLSSITENKICSEPISAPDNSSYTIAKSQNYIAFVTNHDFRCHLFKKDVELRSDRPG